MKNLDAENRPGRFIKKDSPLIERISIIEYDFDEIRETPVTYPDNARQNIIRHEFHDFEDISESVADAESIKTPLIDPNMQAPLIMPRNFTSEWLEDKKKAKRRKSKFFDDEDEIDFDRDFKKTEDEEEDNPSEAKANQEAIEHSIAQAESLPINQTHQEQAKPNSQESLQELQREDLSIDQSLSAMGAVINDFSPEEEEPPQQITENHRPEQENTSQPKEDFIPMNTETQGQTENPENQAIQQYQQRKNEIEQEAQVLREEAKAAGFEAGYKEGEEKAVAEFRAKSEELFSNINHLLGDLEGLQSHILSNVQDNFYELAQALGEAIIEKQINMDPAIFKNLIERAVKDSIDSDKFKVKVNESQLKQLEQLELGQLKDKLAIDNELNAGEFKLESELSTVKSGVRKIISDLLSNAEIDLFKEDDEEVAS